MLVLLLSLLNPIHFTFAAQDPSHSEPPVEVSILENGYARFPVVHCPTASKSGRELLESLRSLEATIKRDLQGACRNFADRIPDVNGVTDGLINQAAELKKFYQKEGGALTPEEQGKVRDMLLSSVKKAAQIKALFTEGENCFGPESKRAKYLMISALLGASAKAVNAFAGPLSLPIALSLEVIPQVFESFIEIMGQKQGYDFENPDQQMAYTESICAFHEFGDRADFFANPTQKVRPLKSLLKKQDKQLDLLKNCEDCDKISADFNARFSSSKNEKGILQITPDQYKQFLTDNATLIDTVNAKYKNRLGSHMSRSIYTKEWIKLEIENIAKSYNDNYGKIEISAIVLKRSQIGDFLFSQSGRFVKYFLGESNSAMNKLMSLMWAERNLMSAEDYTIATHYWYNDPQGYAVVLAHLLDNENLSNISRDNLTRAASDLLVQYGVLDRYCMFYQVNNWVEPNASIKSTCQNPKLLSMVEFLKKASDLYQSNNSELIIPDTLYLNSDPNRFTKDWQGSLDKLISSYISDESKYLEKK